jgi:hypothetical protein
MILYHGTNRRSLRGIVTDGRLSGPVYLTDSLDVAHYFAARNHPGSIEECLVLEVSVDTARLGSDIISLLEPIPMIQNKLGITNEMAYLEEIAAFEDDAWIEMLGERAGIHGKSRWELSLALANAVLHDTHIPLRAIKVVQEQI